MPPGLWLDGRGAAPSRAMNLLLTHEQADFDAAAALLAGWLLDPGARPVVPRRLNRNLRGFLTLYGARLPFITWDELPREPIERVTLVDTQTLPSMKGLSSTTAVHVVDHHPRSPDLADGWTTHMEDVGATTTLLVEALEASNRQLDPIEATLLLIGIYEDTGSLSYAGTTPRDVRAAAWLLEQGATLGLASDFLDHPLTEGQRRVMDHLVEGARAFDIHGLSILIATAEAQGLTEEVSTLAHKLRDLFDPAGLFLLVALDGHVQLVARSSSDSIDVARIAAHFGGGGHSRAAAALIRDRPLREILDDLTAMLPDMVRPLTTVGDIMSGTPQLLSPDVTIDEAADRMQRFGHEGYPVVEGGGVVGLLTRRAVDKAQAHGLGAHPVRSVMDPGDLVVYPDESIEHLQRLMIETDWGQVAVAARDGGAIIGIVTRTDLLHSLSGEVEASAEASVAQAMEDALPVDRLGLLRLVGHTAEAMRLALYVVGGFVRDLLLRQPSVDFDLVVEGDAIGLGKELAKRYGGRVVTHRRFGTAKWKVDAKDARLRRALLARGAAGVEHLPTSLDLVSARAEFYSHPTALPSVQLGSIKLDLHRRDFSINTLAIRLDGAHYGRLLDPWGGGRDLRQKQIRVLHSISFIDDPTRMLRAVRLEQRLGFQIEPRTLELLEQARPLLHRVSGERLRNELDLIFGEPRLAETMTRLESLGLLGAIHPSLTWDSWLADRFHDAADFRAPAEWRLSAQPTPASLRYALWTIRLQPQGAAAVGERLRLTQAQIAVMREASARLQSRTAWSGRVANSRRARQFDDCPETALVALWMALADDPEGRAIVEDYLAGLRFVSPRTDGHALRRRGILPGPGYARILAELRDAWLDGTVTTGAEEEAMLTSLLGGEEGGG